MSTGTGLPQNRGNVVSNIMPGVDVPSSAGMWAAAANLGGSVDQVALNALAKRGAQQGAREGAAAAAKAGEGGPAPKPQKDLLFVTSGAKERAFNAAFVSRIKTDIDSREEALRREYAFDPAGYEAAAAKVKSGFIQGSPPELAIEVEDYAHSVFARGHGVVARVVEAKALEEAGNALLVRQKRAEDRMLSLAGMPGGMASPDYAAAQAEYESVVHERVDNPAFAYSPEQAALERDELLDQVAVGNIGRLAGETYTEAGKGLQGRAAALRFLDSEILNGDTFADLPADRRRKLYAQSVKNLDATYQADREEIRAKEAEEREARAEAREKAGEWRLRIQLGEATEAEILADKSLDDATQASLVASTRAQARRERSEARAVAAAEKAGARQVYNDYRDDALAGTLSDADLADAVKAGTVTPGQAKTLKKLRTGALKPDLDDVMAPVRDAARRPGQSIRGTAVPTAKAEEEALRWLEQHPGATLDEKLKLGETLAKKHLGGGAAAAAGPKPAGPATEKSTKLQALAAERQRRAKAGRPMSTDEYNKRRNEIIHGR